jgi:lipoate-protein ligase A
MQLLDLTLPLPAENLALDEALLESCEVGEIAGGVLRLWEPQDYFVVLGRSSDPTVEVNLAACRREKIPILRRASGGGTILAGRGCLMYAVVTAIDDALVVKSVSRAHQFVLNRIATSLSRFVPRITMAGFSDLVFGDRVLHGNVDTLQKFSGNAVRIKKTHFLYHGTLLYDFDLERVSQLLAHQTREPQYRENRPHDDFIANLPITRNQLITALVSGWQANNILEPWPQQRTREIAKEKYVSDPQWIVT